MGLKHAKPKTSLNSYEAGIGLDVDIVVGERTIKASKYILCQFSSVFTAAISNDRQEKGDNKIVIDGIDFEVMDKVIRALHGIPCVVDIQMALKMLIVADKYEISDIQRQLAEKLIQNITKQNVIQIMLVANELDLEGLLSKCLEFISTGVYDTLDDLDLISNISAEVESKIKEASKNRKQQLRPVS